MSMKKKFLALALAGMVAMPVVANATSISADKTFEGDVGTDFNANMSINGAVRKADGTAPAGKIQVEVPTAVSFTVDQNGGFLSANTFEIANRSGEAIDVAVAQFTESKYGKGITILDRSNLGNDSQRKAKDRSHVSIVLGGNNSNTVDLGTVLADKTGTIEYPLITNLQANSTYDVSINGIAGTAAGGTSVDTTTTASLDAAGTSEDFTLKFKIRKHTI